MAICSIKVKFEESTRLGTKSSDIVVTGIERDFDLSDIHAAKVLAYIKELEDYEGAWRDKGGEVEASY